MLNTLSEDEVLKLLQAERKGPKRVSALQRLHQRYNALRVSRERIELLREATQP
jgi:hypothetical protein